MALRDFKVCINYWITNDVVCYDFVLPKAFNIYTQTARWIQQCTGSLQTQVDT